MCFAGNCGCILNINNNINYIDYLFNEELGLVIEVETSKIEKITQLFNNIVPIINLGKTIQQNTIQLYYNTTLILDKKMTELRYLWELHSYYIEQKQVSNNLAEEEFSLYNNYFNFSIPNASFLYVHPHFHFSCISEKTNVNRDTQRIRKRRKL